MMRWLPSFTIITQAKGERKRAAAGEYLFPAKSRQTRPPSRIREKEPEAQMSQLQAAGPIHLAHLYLTPSQEEGMCVCVFFFFLPF